jgi:TrmH family RNA methyltransferase
MSDAFDLPGFDAGKKGPKRQGKLPSGFKSGERSQKPDRPAAPRKPFKPGDEPRKKFAGDFRPREGEKPAWKKDGPGKSFGGDRPFKKFDGPRKPYGERSADGERPSRSFGGGDRPFKKFDGPRKPFGDRGDRPARPFGDKPAWKNDGPRKPFGDRGDRPARPYGDKPAWKKDGPGKSFGDRPFKKFEDRAPAPFVPELSPEVKKFLPLLTEKGRYKESRFLLEGAKNIADVAESSPEILHAVLVSEGFEDAALKARLDALRVRTRVVLPGDISALCGTETPQGIVAIANFGALRPDWSTIRSVTLLDGVQDPGNLGAILRTSAALGMDAVVLGKGTCDPYNPKVVRASAASLLRMPLETGEDLAAKIHFLRLKGFTVVATSPHAKVTLDQAKLKRKVALLFGNEGGGVGANLIDQADQTVRIPMRGKVESLNVAVAHGLLAYDLMKIQG